MTSVPLPPFEICASFFAGSPPYLKPVKSFSFPGLFSPSSLLRRQHFPFRSRLSSTRLVKADLNFYVSVHFLPCFISLQRNWMPCEPLNLVLLLYDTWVFTKAQLSHRGAVLSSSRGGSFFYLGLVSSCGFSVLFL